MLWLLNLDLYWTKLKQQIAAAQCNWLSEYLNIWWATSSKFWKTCKWLCVKFGVGTASRDRVSAAVRNTDRSTITGCQLLADSLCGWGSSKGLCVCVCVQLRMAIARVCQIYLEALPSWVFHWRCAPVISSWLEPRRCTLPVLKAPPPQLFPLKMRQSFRRQRRTRHCGNRRRWRRLQLLPDIRHRLQGTPRVERWPLRRRRRVEQLERVMRRCGSRLAWSRQASEYCLVQQPRVQRAAVVHANSCPRGVIIVLKIFNL